MSTYAGQNLGAARFDRIGRGLKAAGLIGTATALIMSAVMILFGRPVLGCFLTGDRCGGSGGDGNRISLSSGAGPVFPSTLHFIYNPFLYPGAGKFGAAYGIQHCPAGDAYRLRLLLPPLIGQSGVFYGEVCAWIGADLILACSYFYWMERLRRL